MQNIQQLAAGQYDIAFSLADTAADAVAGKGAFKQPQKVQALGRIHSNYTQVVVRKASGMSWYRASRMRSCLKRSASPD